MAIVGAVTSQVSKAALDWMKDQGSDISEDEWKQVGYQIGVEIQSISKQYQRNTKNQRKLERELSTAGETYQKLSIVGDDYDFDSEIVSLYSDLAEACDQWAANLDIKTPTGDRDNFEEQFKEYKETVMPQTNE